MEIEVKIGKQTLLFSEWEYNQPFTKSRSVKLVDGKINLWDGQEIVITKYKDRYQVLPLYEVAWFGHLLFPLEKIYLATPFRNLKTNKIKEVMIHIDQFLQRASNFSSFI